STETTRKRGEKGIVLVTLDRLSCGLAGERYGGSDWVLSKSWAIRAGVGAFPVSKAITNGFAAYRSCGTGGFRRGRRSRCWGRVGSCGWLGSCGRLWSCNLRLRPRRRRERFAIEACSKEMPTFRMLGLSVRIRPECISGTILTKIT